MSHPLVTVLGVYRFGYLFSQLIILVPMLAVVVAGVVLAVRRRAVIGGRRAGFALAGLALVAVHLLAGAIWSATFPSLVGSLDMGASEFGILVSVVNILTTVLLVAGVALLLAAALSRGNPPFGGPVDHPQAAYPQGGQPPPGYPQSAYQQAGHAQPGHPQSAYPQAGHGQPGHPAGGHQRDSAAQGANVHSAHSPAESPQAGNQPEPDVTPSPDPDRAYQAPTGGAAPQSAEEFYQPPRPDPAQPPHTPSADRPAGTP